MPTAFSARATTSRRLWPRPDPMSYGPGRRRPLHASNEGAGDVFREDEVPDDAAVAPDLDGLPRADPPREDADEALGLRRRLSRAVGVRHAEGVGLEAGQAPAGPEVALDGELHRAVRVGGPRGVVLGDRSPGRDSVHRAAGRGEDESPDAGGDRAVEEREGRLEIGAEVVESVFLRGLGDGRAGQVDDGVRPVERPLDDVPLGHVSGDELDAVGEGLPRRQPVEDADPFARLAQAAHDVRPRKPAPPVDHDTRHRFVPPLPVRPGERDDSRWRGRSCVSVSRDRIEAVYLIRATALAVAFAVAVCAKLSAQVPAWEEIGPFSVGGRVSALAVDAQDPRLILAATPAGGIWRSTDGGRTWTPGVPLALLDPDQRPRGRPDRSEDDLRRNGVALGHRARERGHRRHQVDGRRRVVGGARAGGTPGPRLDGPPLARGPEPGPARNGPRGARLDGRRQAVSRRPRRDDGLDAREGPALLGHRVRLDPFRPLPERRRGRDLDARRPVAAGQERRLRRRDERTCAVGTLPGTALGRCAGPQGCRGDGPDSPPALG